MIIAQYHGTSDLSKLIQWQQRSAISHSSAILSRDVDDYLALGQMSDFLATCVLYEAWATSLFPPRGSVHLRRGILEGHTPQTRIDLFRLDCDDKAAARFLAVQVGAKYDFRALFSFVTRRSRHRKGAWICSELVFQAAIEGGVPPLHRIPAYAVSPGLLHTSPLLIPLGTTWTAERPVFIHARDIRAGFAEATQAVRAITD